MTRKMRRMVGWMSEWRVMCRGWVRTTRKIVRSIRRQPLFYIINKKPEHGPGASGQEWSMLQFDRKTIAQVGFVVWCRLSKLSAPDLVALIRVPKPAASRKH